MCLKKKIYDSRGTLVVLHGICRHNCKHGLRMQFHLVFLFKLTLVTFFEVKFMFIPSHIICSCVVTSSGYDLQFRARPWNDHPLNRTELNAIQKPLQIVTHRAIRDWFHNLKWIFLFNLPGVVGAGPFGCTSILFSWHWCHIRHATLCTGHCFSKTKFYCENQKRKKNTV